MPAKPAEPAKFKGTIVDFEADIITAVTDFRMEPKVHHRGRRPESVGQERPRLETEPTLGDGLYQ